MSTKRSGDIDNESNKKLKEEDLGEDSEEESSDENESGDDENGLTIGDSDEDISDEDLGDGGEDDEESDNSENEGEGETMSAVDLMASCVDIKKVMSSEGPIVKCVLLVADGTSQEVVIDMTPSKRELKSFFGGDFYFIGQWEDIGVILVGGGTEGTDNGKPVTQHILQPPFHGKLGDIQGDIILYRSNKDGIPQNFSLAEYIEFTQKEIEEWEPASDDENNNDEVNSDDEDDDEQDEDEDDENEDYAESYENVLKQVMEQFVADKGRQPTMLEITEIRTAVDDMLENGVDSSDGEDDGEEEVGEDQADDSAFLEAMIQEAILVFTKEHGRKPNEEEMESLRDQVQEMVEENDESDSALEQSGDDEEEDEEEDDEDDNEAPNLTNL